MTDEQHLFSFFDDLEQQAEALFDTERDVELVDRSRSAYHEVTLASRLMASVGRDLRLDVAGVGGLRGRLDRVGAGWCLLHGLGPDWVVSHAAIETVRGVSDRAVPEVAWSPVARLGLGSVLRWLAGERRSCLLHLRDTTRYEGEVGRVGQDFVEVSLVESGGRVLVRVDALAAVQYRG